MRSLIISLTFLLLASPAWAGSGPRKQKSASTKKATTQTERSTAKGGAKQEDLSPRFELDAVPAGKGPLRQKKYFYGSFGTRDPFRSLVDGTFQPRLAELVDLHTVELVGVLWEDDEYVGIVQNAQGFGYALRPGDRVRSGSVVSITKDTLVARMNVFGNTSRVTLRLHREAKE